MAADSIGVLPTDNAEFLVGKVVVTPVFLESNGEIDPETQDWTADEIDEMLAKIDEGVNWWSRALDQLDTVHTLDFVIDDLYAVNPPESPYEPIDNNSFDVNLYLGDFLTDIGYGDAGTIENAVHQLNHSQRVKHDADWAFTIFVADSSDDPDGLFASGGQFAAAFAFAGGLFMVTPSTRPASTIAHEMGHIFWARDEYAGAGSWTDTRGYYNAQNLNAADNPTEGFEQQISIMRGGIPLGEAYDQLVSPESTLAMVGWRDSDGDGIFDFADVPLSLSGIGSFDSETSLYRFQGEASAVALPNQNSSGNQSDITLNEVTRLEYRIDDGNWQTASDVGAQRATLDVEFEIADSFSSIELRVIDGSTGVVSNTVLGASDAPALSDTSILGFAYLDEDGGEQRDESEVFLSGLPVIVTRDDGSPLFYRSIHANDVLDDQAVNDAVPGLSFSADGAVSDSVVSTGTTTVSSDSVFESFDLQRQRVSERWGEKVSLIVDIAEPVGDVSVSVIGLDNGSYARVEALDASGNLIVRETSALIVNGDASLVSVSDPEGRIRTVRVFGHAETDILISGVVAGTQAELTTGASGQWQLPNLPSGDYRVSIEPDLIIHQFNQLPDVVTVSGGASSPISAAATRIDSALYNSTNAGDVNQDDSVTSLDALVIINDLGRDGARNLTLDEANGPKIDVNNDGVVSALDALLVINLLDDALVGEGESIGSGQSNGPQVNASNADFVLGKAFSNEHSDLVALGNTDPDRGNGFSVSESVAIFAEVSGQDGRIDAPNSMGDVDPGASIVHLNTDSLDGAPSNAGESAGIQVEVGAELVSLSSDLDQEIKEPFG